MKSKKEVVYRCEYCNKPYVSRSGCVRHELYCFRNDNRKTCNNCIHGSIDGNKCSDFYKYGHKTLETKNEEYMVVDCKGWKVR